MAIEVFSTDTDSGQISVVRRNGDKFEQVASIPVGNAPRGSVKFTSDGRGFVSNTSTNTVSEIDALRHEEVARIRVGSGPRGLAVVDGEKFLLVSNSGSDTVSVVDLCMREAVLQVPVGRDPRHMALAGDFAYICLWGEGALAKVDISALRDGNPAGVEVVGRIVLGPDTFPYSLNIEMSRMHAYVACNALKSVPVVDLKNDSLLADVSVRAGGARALAFTPDNKFALVTLERDSSIAVIDTDSHEVTRFIETGPSPRGIAVDEVGTIYAAAFSRETVMRHNIPDYGAHSVSIIDVSNADLSRAGDDAVLDSVTVGFGPCSVSVFDTEKASLDNVDLESSALGLIQA